MKVSLPQPALAALLAKGGCCAKQNGVAPILAAVRLRTANDTLYIASTDGDLYAEASDVADVSVQGTLCLNAQALSALISRYPKDGVVSIEQESPTTVRVKCGRSRIGMPAMAAVLFPQWAPPKAEHTFEIAGRELAAALARVKPMAMQPGQAFEGTFVEPGEGELNIVTFNGHVMGWLKMPLPEGAEGAPAMILPSVTVDVFSRLFRGEGAVTIRASEGRIVFEASGARLASRLLEGRIPPYRLLDGVRDETKVVADRADFRACLERAVLSAEAEGALHMVLLIPQEDGLGLKTRNHHGGEARETVQAEIVGDFSVAGLSPDYMASVLGAITTERFVIEEAIKGSRFLIYGEDDPDFLAGLAPIKNPAISA